MSSRSICRKGARNLTPPCSLLADFLGFSAGAGVTKMSSSSSPSEEQGIIAIFSEADFLRKMETELLALGVPVAVSLKNYHAVFWSGVEKNWSRSMKLT